MPADVKTKIYISKWNDPQPADVYEAELILPRKNQEGVCLQKTLIGMPPTNEFEIVIGMDIICAGDFTFSNFEGKTLLSFRMDSSAELNFDVEDKNTYYLD